MREAEKPWWRSRLSGHHAAGSTSAQRMNHEIVDFEIATKRDAGAARREGPTGTPGDA
jgi:hypothetical protein